MTRHFATPGNRVQSAHEPGQHGTVTAITPHGFRVRWDGLNFDVICTTFDLELPGE